MSFPEAIIVRRLTFLGLFAVAGCTRGERAAVSDTTGVTPSAQPEAPSATLTVSERGIGQLRAGMSMTEAAAALGGALSLPANADPAGCSYAAWSGGPPGVRVMVDAGRIARVEVDSAGIATVAGAKVGDTEEHVLGLYSGRATVGPQKYEDGHYLTVRDAADTTFALVFETVAGRVTRYRAGRRPHVEYVEGCS